MQRASSMPLTRGYANLRTHRETVAETFIELLDFMDGDLDLESSGDEAEDEGTLEADCW